jgi:hypothetical protein
MATINKQKIGSVASLAAGDQEHGQWPDRLRCLSELDLLTAAARRRPGRLTSHRHPPQDGRGARERLRVRAKD